MQRRLCAAILLLEAIVLGLTTPVLLSVSDTGHGTALVIGLGTMIGALVLAGLLRFTWAYWLGWALQVLAIGLGLLVSAMYFLGAVFLALWATAYLLGAKIETDRAEWERTGEYPGAPGGA